MLTGRAVGLLVAVKQQASKFAEEAQLEEVGATNATRTGPTSSGEETDERNEALNVERKPAAAAKRTAGDHEANPKHTERNPIRMERPFQQVSEGRTTNGQARTSADRVIANT